MILLRLILSIGTQDSVMDRCRHSNTCPADCGLRYICHCLRVTEAVLAEAFATHDIQTLKDIRRHTGAGDGCMSCHRRLQTYLERHSVTASVAAVA
jgi:bacterioferritin-associated ferredoxin